MKTESICKACEGRKISSKGKPCLPCNGSGKATAQKSNVISIVEFTMTAVGLTEHEYNKAQKHPDDHGCEVCKKFRKYLRYKNLIEKWEKQKGS